MIDDLRPELGIYGSDVAITPNMDNFARSGIVFDRAFTSQALCAPSRFAFLASLRPTTTGITALDTTLDAKLPSARTMPDLFRAAGYQTLGFGKIYHEQDDDADGFTKRAPLAVAPWFKKNPGQIPPVAARWDPSSELEDDINVGSAIAELAKLGTTKAPFFMAIGISRPHLPWIVPSADWDRYSASSVGKPINPDGQAGAPLWALGTYELSIYSELKDELPFLSDETTARLRWGYLASVTYADRLVGEILNQLQASGLDKNTVVVLWGDHGFKLGDHRYWGKLSNADIDIRVPLIVRAPGVTSAGTRSPAIVESVDVMPTLAELAGLQAPSENEGLSFRPLFSNPALPWKSAAFAQYPRLTAAHGELMGYTVRTARYRYTAWEKPDGSVLRKELYDLQFDPEESTNIADRAGNVGLVQTLEETRKRGWRAVRDQVSKL